MIGEILTRSTLNDVHEDLFRNIVSLRVSENLFDDLSDDPDDQQVAIKLELETKPSRFVSRVPIIGRPFEEAAWNEAIAYPFRTWMMSRYSDGSFGVWYGADSIETTVHETAFHWYSQLLTDAGFAKPGVSVERKIYTVRCDAALIDLRKIAAESKALTHSSDYTLTHQIGGRLHKEGHPGLISKSARHSGDVFAVLNQDVLSNPKNVCFLSYKSTENGVLVEREPGVEMMTVPFSDIGI